MKTLTFVEIDLDYCARSYGVGGCPARMTGANPTGDRKCFNTLATCQARQAFQNVPVTLRFAKGTADLVEAGIDAIPALENESFTPPTVSLGENLGTRASLSLTFSDFKWPDTGAGFDKYAAERPYDPFEQGTFWGKFRARHPYLRGRTIRLIRGTVGQSLDEMETRHFIMESFEGPSLDGRYTITAKDALKMADDDRAQAPRPNNGYLLADLTETATTTVIGPIGIGNLEYPASGYMNIGGNEIVYFTRSGDTLTLSRGQYNTERKAHKAQDRAQVCLRYVGQNPADILRDLFVNYAQMPASYIPITNWRAETNAFLGVLYSTLIAEPTGVNKLASELVQQAGLAVWWDDIGRQMRLQVLRQILTDAARFDDETILHGTMRIRDQPEKRLSQVWVYYGQVNPLVKADEPTNYRSMHIAADPVAEADYGQPAVKKIYGRFIPEFGRLVAQRAGDIQLGQNVNAPRQLTFETFRDNEPTPALGLGCNVLSRPLQTDTGAPLILPFMINRLTPTDGGYRVEGLEARFRNFQSDTSDRTIIIATNTANFNFRAAYNQLFPTPVPSDDVICIILPGAIVYSTSTGLPAFNVGAWPAGVVPRIQLQGRIQGAGGNAGSNSGGLPGGSALYARSAVRLESASGQLWGGGGGGGGARFGTAVRVGGGGGAGFVPGLGAQGAPNEPGRHGAHGTHTSGGARGASGGANPMNGGVGGGPGLAGASGWVRYPSSSAVAYAGGAAGRSIDGWSFVTQTGSIDRRGPVAN